MSQEQVNTEETGLIQQTLQDGKFAGEEPPSEEGVEPQIPDKFKNTDGTLNHEALLKSYTDLEKKLGESPQEGDTSQNQQEQKEGAGEEESTPVSYGDKIDPIIISAGLTPETLNNEWLETGDLSEKTYDALEKNGLSKSLVKAYVEGQKALLESSQAADEDYVKTVHDSVGGEDKYNVLIEFANREMSIEEQEEYTKLVTSGDMSTGKLAAQNLKLRYENKYGSLKEPKLTLGGSPQSRDTFKSALEASRVMAAARKTGDPAKIKEIEEKMMRSNY